MVTKHQEKTLGMRRILNTLGSKQNFGGTWVQILIKPVALLGIGKGRIVSKTGNEVQHRSVIEP